MFYSGSDSIYLNLTGLNSCRWPNLMYLWDIINIRAQIGQHSPPRQNVYDHNWTQRQTLCMQSAAWASELIINGFVQVTKTATLTRRHWQWVSGLTDTRINTRKVKQRSKHLQRHEKTPKIRGSASKRLNDSFRWDPERDLPHAPQTRPAETGAPGTQKLGKLRKGEGKPARLEANTKRRI